MIMTIIMSAPYRDSIMNTNRGSGYKWAEMMKRGASLTKKKAEEGVYGLSHILTCLLCIVLLVTALAFSGGGESSQRGAQAGMGAQAGEN